LKACGTAEAVERVYSGDISCLRELRTIEVTVLFTPAIFIIPFLRTSLNLSTSRAETTLIMSNSPVIS